jgi:hypothetical protein
MFDTRRGGPENKAGLTVYELSPTDGTLLNV